MLRAITFDFWGTLYRNTYARDERLELLGRALADHGQPRSRTELETAENHVWSVWERVWRQEQRSMTFEDWMAELLDYLEVELPEETIASLRRPIEEIYLTTGEPKPIPGVAEIVPRLAERYRLGVISDTGITPGRVLREVMDRDGLLHHFEILTFSDETGRTKPRAEQFLGTLSGLETKPEEAVHIGDLPETDLAGARGVGMKAILFLGVSDRQDGIPLADGVFSDYEELEKVLERLA
jgi:putative hydrolase of the HAD superfamily